MISYIYKYIFKNRKVFLILSFLNFFIWVSTFINPYLSGKIIDFIQLEKNSNKVFFLIGLFLILSLINIIISFFKNKLLIQFKSKASFNLNCDILDHIKKINILETKKYSSTYLTERINNDSNTLISYFIDNIWSLFLSIFTLGLSIYIIATINSKIIFILLIFFMPLYLLTYYLFKNKIKFENFQVIENQSKFFYHLNEQLENIETIKIDSSFNIYKNFLEKSFSNLLNSVIKFTNINCISDSIKSMLNLFSHIFIFIISTIEIINKRMTIGELLIINSYFAMFTNQINYYLSLGNNLQSAINAYNRIIELLNISQENNGSKIINEITSINLIKASFSYDSKIIFSNFTYEFKQGYIYCIKGLNGQGKSTLLKLLIGLLKPNISGEILFNDINIDDLDIYYLRQNLIAMLPQNFNLRNDSIYNNICLGLDTIDLNKLNNICNELSFTDFLNTLELGIHTNLVNESQNLSGGEKEKIGLIKTLMKDSQLLILDEPSTALDINSTYNLKLLLKRLVKNRIIILITHDENLSEIADFNLNINAT